MNLLSFQKPSRYLNREVNSLHKRAFVTVALAFPDIYEVGMSHLGLKILYEIINGMSRASAERVFSPWLDLDEAMKQRGWPLVSLESKRPLKDFDIVGFSLQYELSYPTVLNMLHLGGIPIRAVEREDPGKYPLIIAGGPCTANPYPMSPFIDAFLIGDGEEAVQEILISFQLWKEDGMKARSALLETLSEIDGVFVPSLHGKRKIRRRYISPLEDAPFPVSPIVPFTGIIHDRVNIEISRGCSRGCRFCQAGMICRPVRERSPEKILELAEKSILNTGYDGISFTSLSAGDYTCLLPLMQEFNRRFHKRRISMSLPSLRVASVNSHMLREIRSVRKTGFTIAPEAGSERLRRVINKDFSEEQYVQALETLFREGWRNLKLYFMTGLPTENEADIEAIPEMVLQAIKISKGIRNKHINISVGVSSFIPKAHTPFQWCAQNDLALLREKNTYLKRALLRKGVRFKGHNEEMSLIEAILARGDETLADFIEHAWTHGCRLDAWTEAFDFGKWKKAMETSGTNAMDFALKEYAYEDPLPWDNIVSGIEKNYLFHEYRNALEGKSSPDCRKLCRSCGLSCGPDNVTQQPAVTGQTGISMPITLQRPGKGSEDRNTFVRVRLQYSKTGSARYLSHLELTTALIRAMRRAGFPFRYSGGFHPAPRVSFGPALRVGIAGLREYLDVELVKPFERESALEKLGRTLPEGLRAEKMEVISHGEKSLNSFIIKYVYEIKHGNRNAIERFLAEKEVHVERKSERVNIRNMVEEIVEINRRTVHVTVTDQGETRVRLDEILPEIFDASPEELDITRIALFGWDGTWREPMAGEKMWAVRS